MSQYPFLNTIKQRLNAQGENLSWLATQMDMSRRWLEKITDIEDVQTGKVMELSKILAFDFMADYYQFLIRNGAELSLVSEPAVEYKKASDDVSFTVTIRGSVKNASKILAAIQAEGLKQGYKID